VRLVKIVNRTREAVIAERAEMAENIWTRFKGLMGRRGLDKGTGLVIFPNNGVHMFFMRFAIDVLHVAADGTILKICHSLKPWRVGPIVRKCKYTVELPAGVARLTGTAEGDRIELIPLSGSKK
jgi:uncharacterized protein